MRALAVFLAVALGASAARAEDTPDWLQRQSPAVRQAFDDHGCMARADTNVAWAECGGIVINQVDALLNRTWARLLPLLQDEKSRADLRDEQRAWIAYKDKSCVFWASGEFGRQGQVLDYQGCRARVIGERIHDLEELEKELRALRG